MNKTNPFASLPPVETRALPLLWRKIKRGVYRMYLQVHPGSIGCGLCKDYMSPLGARTCHEGAADFPVDVVYTWVDGADEEHAAKRDVFLPMQDNVHVNGLEKARFRNNEELRYSLRSLHDYCPWIRNIILVTDSQIPSWIQTEHPQVRVVDHTEFIPSQYLPTFNSHVIEAFLHKIPGLAEHFMYLNDDVFIARPCRKTEFFTSNGLPMAFVDWRARRLSGYKITKTPHAQSYFNALDMLKQHNVPTDPNFITAHGPYPQTISNAEDAFAFYQPKIEEFAHNRFRTTQEIAMYSHGIPLFSYYKRRLVPCDERYYYVQTRRRDRIAYYNAILNSKNDRCAPLFFCINDVGGSSPNKDWKNDLRGILQSYFPQAAPYEKAGFHESLQK